ncbi:hypothetical protein CPter91_1971 [Collimonas pratensis]|uniref:Uncharacterized protein n=1 Tax=Collimonas pratensis TaxID=279113 RepID=A0A127Q2T8_9BURK|nr:hypothetical protein CPter91_1971 [Collimonas pratensis]
MPGQGCIVAPELPISFYLHGNSKIFRSLAWAAVVASRAFVGQ